MNIQQCRYLVAVSNHGCNLTDAAKSLYTSQPGISKQLKLLEDELGVELLVRRRNRVVGFTTAGEAGLNIAKRLLRDVERLRELGRDPGLHGRTTLTIAATHVQARYVLLPLLQKFKARFGAVDIRLMQCNPDQVAHLVVTGVADMGLSIAATTDFPDLVRLPVYKIERSVIAPFDHPLTRIAKVTIGELAKYPLISLDSSFTAGVSVISSFHEAGITPNIVMSATDADIIKAYVEAGFGIATIPSIAFDPNKDSALSTIEAKHLFSSSVVSVWLHRDAYASSPLQAMIHMLSPHWNASSIEEAMQGGAPVNVTTLVSL